MTKAKRKARVWYVIVRKRNRGGRLIYDYYDDLKLAKSILDRRWNSSLYEIIKVREVLPRRKK